MNIKEFGKENNEVVLLLHGGGLAWWNYKEAAEILSSDYHVVVPALDGHAGSDCDFTSIEDNAEKLIQLIDENFNGSVSLIAGLSLGGQILVEMLAQRPDICRHALIESALVIEMKMTCRLVKPTMDLSYGLISQKWFSKLQFRSLKIKDSLYEDYYRDTCVLTKENMISFLRANASYNAKDELKKVQAKTWIVVGEKEPKIMIQSAQLLNRLIPDSKLTIMPKQAHGEFSINHANEYSEFVHELLKSKI